MPRGESSMGVGNRTGASLSRPSSLFDRTGHEKGELAGGGDGIGRKGGGSSESSPLSETYVVAGTVLMRKRATVNGMHVRRRRRSSTMLGTPNGMHVMASSCQQQQQQQQLRTSLYAHQPSWKEGRGRCTTSLPFLSMLSLFGNQ
ncbi:hypothetical protein MUK42_00473 [Musa troglodytarum]|uniref:Uncharacterized protein n=1 Tax=Musa troglodytarum TaxID=320322 RepID=A0A9E7F8Y8_9LILI|nr:hypothetical protein MUK42_00473 [Musa troglodytarum]